MRGPSLDGDTLVDLIGSPLVTRLAAGTWARGPTTATATHACADPSPQSCATTDDTVAEPGGGRLVVEDAPEAAAYNVHADLIGSWHAPSPASGTVCHVGAWTDNGDGTLTLDVAVPARSGVVATASNRCGEDPTGVNSPGADRLSLGPWTGCGAAP